MKKAPKILLSFSCLLAVTAPACLAAEHSQVKQVYVPASQIPRRYDNEMFFGTEAVPKSNLYKATSHYGKPPGKTTSSASEQSNSSASKALPYKKVAKTNIYKKSTDPFVQVTGAQFQSATAIKHADTLIAQGKLKDAQALLMKVHKSFPQEPKLKEKIAQVSVLRSNHFLKSGDQIQAASQSRLALAFDYNSENAKNSLDKAMLAMNVDPKSSIARLKQGHALYSQGKTLDAAIEYRAALNTPLQSDSHAEALVGLGNIAAHHKDMTNAKANYEAALHQNPNSSTAYRQYGIFQYKQNELIKANRNLSKALIVNPDDEAAKEKLIELWQHQIVLRPQDAVTHLGMARAYQLAGDLKSAQTEYKTVVKIDPNHPNLPQARESFKVALVEQEARKHLASARTLENHNALREAYAKANEAARIAPNNLNTKLYQAHLAERIGNYKDAKAFYLNVLSQDPNNATASAGVRKYANILATGEHPIELKAQAGAINGSENFDSFNSGRRIEGPRNWSFGVPPNRPERYTGSEEPPLANLPAFPMTVAGAPATGLSPAMYGNAMAKNPNIPYSQIPTGDPIANMGGFLGQLRNHMVSEKQKWKDWEDQVHNGMKPVSPSDLTLSSPSASSPASSVEALLNSSPSTPAASAAATATTSPLSKPLITSGDVQSLLKSLKAGKTAAAAPINTTTATAASNAASIASTALPTTAPPIAPPIQTQSKLGVVANALSNAAAGRPLTPQPYSNGYGYRIPFVSAGPPRIDPQTGKAIPTNIIQTPIGSLQTNGKTNWTALAAQAGTVIAQNQTAIKAAAVNAAQKMQPYVENVKNSLNKPVSTSVAETTKAKLLPTTSAENTTASSTTYESVPTMEALSQASIPDEVVPNTPKIADENAIALAAPDSLTSDTPSTPINSSSELTKQSGQYATNDNRISNLENQNSQLRDQLEQANAKLKSINGGNPNSTQSAYKSPLAPGPVRLELLGVSSTEKTTTLNVMLRNDTNEQMKLPSSTRAVVRLYGTRDQVAKVKFDKKNLNPHENMRGTITVQAPKLSPAADVLIPNLMSTNDGGQQDLHLTIPISSTFGVNK